MAKRTIVITGGAGILGQAVAGRAVAAGCQVARIDRAPIADDDSLAGHLRLGGVDLTDRESAGAAFAAIATEFGGFDVLMNIAGGFIWETLEGGKVESWERMFAINVQTAVTACQAAMPWLCESASGRMVNAVLPSVLDTPTNRADMPDADPADWVAPEDLAAVMLFLASEEACAVTGALLPVTGRV